MPKNEGQEEKQVLWELDPQQQHCCTVWVSLYTVTLLSEAS